jgi:hypothetical protein
MGSANPKRAPKPVAVRCSGCRKAIAWTDGLVPLRNKVFCSRWCMDEPIATPTEARTDQWRVLSTAGWKPVAIGHLYDVAHSQVYGSLGR